LGTLVAKLGTKRCFQSFLKTIDLELAVDF
jgi:hypothetical protein